MEPQFHPDYKLENMFGNQKKKNNADDVNSEVDASWDENNKKNDDSDIDKSKNISVYGDAHPLK